MVRKQYEQRKNRFNNKMTKAFLGTIFCVGACASGSYKRCILISSDNQNWQGEKINKKVLTEFLVSDNIYIVVAEIRKSTAPGRKASRACLREAIENISKKFLTKGAR